MSNDTITIVVVDDHHLFRAGLIELLGSVPHFAICAEGASGDDAVRLAHEHSPDLILLDIEMPGPETPETIRRISDASARTQVVVLTMHDAPELVRDILAAGAAGYLVKTAGRDELIAAINAARRHEGTVFLCVSRATLLNLGRGRPRRTLGDALSERETEVVRQLASGGSNREIAAALLITEATVKRHLANVYAKFGVASRIDAMRAATSKGIIRTTRSDEIVTVR